MTKKKSKKMLLLGLPILNTLIIAGALIACVALVLVYGPNFIATAGSAFGNGSPLTTTTTGTSTVTTTSNAPFVPPNPTLALSITPDTVDREGNTIVTVTSNMRNVPLEGWSYYEGDPAFFSIGTIGTLNNVGVFTTNTPQPFAGFWQIRVSALTNTVQSNVQPLIVEGITIYQQKSDWNTGETYTNALTGTYRNWNVGVLVKWHNQTNWVFYGFVLSDGVGRIPFGVYMQPIPPTMSNSVIDVIGIIDHDDPAGVGIYELINQDDQILASVLNNAVNSGQIVESNILTFNVGW